MRSSRTSTLVTSPPHRSGWSRDPDAPVRRVAPRDLGNVGTPTAITLGRAVVARRDAVVREHDQLAFRVPHEVTDVFRTSARRMPSPRFVAIVDMVAS